MAFYSGHLAGTEIAKFSNKIFAQWAFGVWNIAELTLTGKKKVPSPAAQKKKKKVNLPLFLLMDPLNLTTKDLAFTAYQVAWVPSSSRICAVGATGRSTGKLAIFDLDGQVLGLTTEVSPTFDF